MNRETANDLRRLVLVDDGPDWILIVPILSQRDDGVLLLRPKEDMAVSASGATGCYLIA